MRVALDARRLQDPHLTGVGRRLRNLVPLLAPHVEVVLLTDASRPSTGLDCEEVALRPVGGLPEPAWLQVRVARWLRDFDGVFHGTYNAIPFAGRCPSVVTMHDLSWEHHSEDYSRIRRDAFRVQARWSARHATSIVVVSQFMLGSLTETYGVPASRVVVAPPGVDPIFSPDRAVETAPILERLGVQGPYVLALGGARRRGLGMAIDAWSRLAAPRPALVVVGSQVHNAEGLVGTPPLDDHEWAAVMAGADAFCYPTQYEGFGMPALEAAASGTPVVCSPIGPLPEILGDAAEWCAPGGLDALVAALSRVVTDERRRAELRTAGLERAAAAPTWQDCADAVLVAYEMAAR